VGAEPRQEVAACTGCGAIGTPDGKALDNRCRCKGDADMQPFVVVPDTPELDPVEGVPNVYAERVRARVTADLEYLARYASEGHTLAAGHVCEALGHDGRAGVCLRCGSRGVRAEDD
jgi:hypothetical protein